MATDRSAYWISRAIAATTYYINLCIRMLWLTTVGNNEFSKNKLNQVATSQARWKDDE